MFLIGFCMCLSLPFHHALLRYENVRNFWNPELLPVVQFDILCAVPPPQSCGIWGGLAQHSA